ncbi:MAG: hypothetical protein WC759_02995 [Candidatus Micrarchaeia archaeon]
MRDIYESRFWRETVMIAVAVLAFIVVCEFLLNIPPSTANFAAVELLAFCVLASNLFMGYWLALSKREFLVHHAFELVLMLPLFEFLRVAQYDYALFRILKLGTHFETISEGAGYAVNVMRYRLG